MSTKSSRKTYEVDDLGDAIRRLQRALVRRAAEGDIEAVRVLSEVAADNDAALHSAVHAARSFVDPLNHSTYSWTDIGRALNVTRQSAQFRFRTEEK